MTPIMIIEPIFQLIPKIKLNPAPVPDIFPIVKNKQDKKVVIPTMIAATGP